MSVDPLFSKRLPILKGLFRAVQNVVNPFRVTLGTMTAQPFT